MPTRKCKYIQTMLLCLVPLFILQCKKGSQQNTNAAFGLTGSACGLGLDAFNVGPLVPIDASTLAVQTPSFITLSYANNQKTLLLLVNPVIPSNSNNYPDYAAYTITDGNNNPCLKGQTGSSFSKEIYIPASCAPGTMTVSVQGCAIPPRLQNPKIACGVVQRAQYVQVANPNKTSLGDVLSLIQENEKELGLVASWLGNSASNFINSVSGNLSSLSSTQQSEYSLALLFSREQSDFADIFSSNLYTQLQNAAASQSQNSATGTGLGLAATTTSTPTCSSLGTGSAVATNTQQYAAAQAQINANLNTTETTVNIQTILSSARAQYAATGGAPSLTYLLEDSTDTSLETSTSTVTNNAKSVTMGSSPIGSIAGGILVGMGVLYGAVFIAQTAAKVRAAAKVKLFTELNPELVEVVEGVEKPVDYNPKKVSVVAWTDTGAGWSDIYSYEGKVLVKNSTGKYTLVEPSAAGITDPTKAPWYAFTKQANTLESATEAQKAALQSGGVAQVSKEAATTPTAADYAKGSLSWHLAGIGSVLGAGIAMIAGASAGTFLASGTGNVFTNFLDDMQSAQTAITNLRAENDSLQALKTSLVVNSLSATP